MKKKEINLPSYEEILGDSGQVKEIPLSELYEFKNHPFKVREDAEFSDLLKSIQEYGVLTPGVARKRNNGGYELISGHRRKAACEKLGLPSMPVIIKDFSDDEASILVVDSNIQRQNISHSEKARAYALKYDALRHQGKKGGSTLEIISNTAGENAKTIQRYILLSRLNENLLDKVDKKQISFMAGVELSYLTEAQQDIVAALDRKINKQQARKIRDAAESNSLNAETVNKIFENNTKVQELFFILDYRKIQDYFGENFDAQEAESIIYKLLDDWKSN